MRRHQPLHVGWRVQDLLKQHSQRLSQLDAVSDGDALHQKIQQDDQGSRSARHVYFDDNHPAPPSATLLDEDSHGPLRVHHVSRYGRQNDLTPEQWARSRGVRRPSSADSGQGRNRKAAAVASAMIRDDVQRTLGMTGDLRATVVSLTAQLERMTEVRTVECGAQRELLCRSESCTYACTADTTQANKNLSARCDELENARQRSNSQYVVPISGVML